jgi:hypothetical protein
MVLESVTIAPSVVWLQTKWLRLREVVSCDVPRNLSPRARIMLCPVIGCQIMSFLSRTISKGGVEGFFRDLYSSCSVILHKKLPSDPVASPHEYPSRNQACQRGDAQVGASEESDFTSTEQVFDF